MRARRGSLAVRDNGDRRAPEDFKDRRKSGGSLGLRIVAILGRQLKGTFDFRRNRSGQATGSVFRISFPEHKTA